LGGRWQGSQCEAPQSLRVVANITELEPQAVSVNIPAGFGSAAWVLTSTDGTSPFITTCGVEVDPVAETQEVANALFAAYATTFMSQTGNTLRLERVVLTIPVGDGTVGTVESDQPTVLGSLSGERCSLSMALLVNKRTAGIGRSSRGRMFLPGILAQTAVDTAGLLEPATVTAFQTVLNTFYGKLLAGAGEFPVETPPVLLHTDALRAPTPISGFTVSNKVGSLRRRIR
jgi:hypothetical protein